MLLAALHLRTCWMTAAPVFGRGSRASSSPRQGPPQAHQPQNRDSCRDCAEGSWRWPAPSCTCKAPTPPTLPPTLEAPREAPREAPLLPSLLPFLLPSLLHYSLPHPTVLLFSLLSSMSIKEAWCGRQDGSKLVGVCLGIGVCWS